MSNETKKEGVKFIGKPAKGKMGGLLIVFAWIAVWNVIYQAAHGLWHDSSIQIVNWAFFAAVTLFFMQEELTYKERFWHTMVGGTVGLVLAAGIGFVCTVLMKNGVGYTAAVCIPLVIAIAVLILAHPYLPVLFNNVGFIYLIVAFVESDKVVSMLPSYIISLVLGSLILNLGCSFFIGLYTKALTKKAIAAAQKQAQVK